MGPVQFGLFRILLGSYLAWHFARVMPYAEELYGPLGLYPPPVATPFPNLLLLLDSGFALQLFAGAMVALALCLAAGVARPAAALVLWYGWACCVNRIPLLFIPSDGVVGWMLLLCVVSPRGEAFTATGSRNENWRLPGLLAASAWIVLGLGYFVSGLDKLDSPSWRAGTAIRAVLTSPMSTWAGLGELVSSVSHGLLAAGTWGVLAAELSFAFLAIHPLTRPIAWCLVTGMHVAIRLTMELHDISHAMLIAHLLLFDARWLAWGSSGDEDGANITAITEAGQRAR